MEESQKVQSALTSWSPGMDWSKFKEEHHLKGTEVSRFLETFSSEFQSAPTCIEGERARFFSTCIPEIIHEIQGRRDEIASAGRVQQFFSSLFGRGVSKKENQIHQLESAKVALDQGLQRLDPSSWSLQHLPEHPLLTCQARLAMRSKEQVPVDPQGHYFLYSSGRWKQLDPLGAQESKGYQALLAQIEKEGGDPFEVQKALKVASRAFRDTLLEVSSKFQNVDTAAYLYCDPNGQVLVRLEGVAEVVIDSMSGDRTKVKLVGLFNPSEEPTVLDF